MADEEDKPQLRLTHYTSKISGTTPLHSAVSPLPPPPSPSTLSIINNEDLLTEILLCLPPKSLLRLQCVSKLWLSIISRPNFRRLHARRNPTSSAAATNLFFYRVFCWVPEFNFLCLSNSLEDVNSMRVITSNLSNRREGFPWRIHSCNGLICLDPYDDESTKFFMYNPTTNQSRFIQLPDSPEDRHSIRDLSLAFDPLKPDHYKILCVWMRLPEIVLRFSLYSSETGVWKETDESYEFDFEWDEELDEDDNLSSMFNSINVLFKYGAYLDDAMHWANADGDFLCFDLWSERFKPMPSPLIPDDQWRRNILYFGESGGHLHLIETYSPRATLVDVLEMESDYSKWYVKHRVDLDFLIAEYPLIVNEAFDPDEVERYQFRVPSFVADEKENKAKLVLSLPGKLISYDIITKKVVEHVEINPPGALYFGENLTLYDWIDAHKHLETLACV
ncbi:F-box protein At5g07610-like [Coffea arabica]|uniref:F-box protein At5g07610-like n=1 Tax=Coffea arabica TaxID=13443 RepID=A0ABM4UXH5_COFAR